MNEYIFSFFRSQRLVDKGLNTFFSRFIIYCLINQLAQAHGSWLELFFHVNVALWQLMTGWAALPEHLSSYYLRSKWRACLISMQSPVTLTFSHYEVLLAYVQSLGRTAKEETSKTKTDYGTVSDQLVFLICTLQSYFIHSCFDWLSILQVIKYIF